MLALIEQEPLQSGSGTAFAAQFLASCVAVFQHCMTIGCTECQKLARNDPNNSLHVITWAWYWHCSVGFVVSTGVCCVVWCQLFGSPNGTLNEFEEGCLQLQRNCNRVCQRYSQPQCRHEIWYGLSLRYRVEEAAGPDYQSRRDTRSSQECTRADIFKLKSEFVCSE